jgi:hypothetical protein
MSRVAVSGNYAYVAGAQGLVVLDMKNPSAPVEVGSCALGKRDNGTTEQEAVFDIKVRGSYVYVLADGGLNIYDASSPQSVSRLKLYSGGVGYQSEGGFELVGNYAVISWLSPGLDIVDISNPNAANLPSDSDSTFFGGDVALAGRYAYIATKMPNAIKVVDVGDPSTPVVATVLLDDIPAEVAVSNSLLAVTSYDKYVHLFHLGSPASPIFVSKAQMAVSVKGRRPQLDGSDLFVMRDSDLVRLDVSSSLRAPFAEPTVTGILSGAALSPQDVQSWGEHLLVVDQPLASGSLRVVRRMNGIAPVSLGSVPEITGGESVVVDGTHTLVARGDTGIEILDTRQLTQPIVAGALPTLGYAQDAVSYGSLALVADGASGLLVVDTATKNSPGLLASYDTPGNAYAIAVDGQYAWVADGDSGLIAVDLKIPANPTLGGLYNTTGSARDVAVSGPLAFVADGSNGLVIVNIADPTNLTLMSTHATEASARGVAISGNVVLVALGSEGVISVDVSNPAAPLRLGKLDTSGVALSIGVWGQYGVLADGQGGLKLLRISNPASMTLDRTFSTTGSVTSATIVGEAIYLTEGSGFKVLRAFTR